MIGSVAFLAPVAAGRARDAAGALVAAARACRRRPGRTAFPGRAAAARADRPGEDAGAHALVAAPAADAALAAAILAFAGPVLNPRPEGSGAPLLVLLDGGWGDAPDWAARMDRAAGGARRGRPRRPAGGGGDDGDAAGAGRRRCPGGRRRTGASGWAGWRRAPGRRTAPAGPAGSPRRTSAFETLWLTDGIGHGGEAASRARCSTHGPVTLAAPPATALALTPPRLEDGAFGSACSAPAARRAPVGVVALGPDPNGIERVLGVGDRRVRRRRGRARPRDRHADRAAQPRRPGAARPRGVRRRAWCSPTIPCAGARSG